MANPQRTKPSSKGVKRKNAAKHSLKKKQLSSIKSRNDDLRESLDRQAHSLFPVYGVEEPITIAKALPVDVSQSLSDVTATLRNL